VHHAQVIVQPVEQVPIGAALNFRGALRALHGHAAAHLSRALAIHRW
jgi:hypothetical protein